MSPEIKMENEDHWNFSLYADDYEIWDRSLQQCEHCGMNLQKPYSYIIDCLDEAGLLPEDYKQICCYCYVLQKFGLLELNHDLISLIYIESLDILKIYFSFEIEDGVYDSKDKFCFRIHDYSKL